MIAPSFLLKDFSGHIDHARRGGVVLSSLDFYVFMAELVDNGLFTREQADIAKIESRIQ